MSDFTERDLDGHDLETIAICRLDKINGMPDISFTDNCAPYKLMVLARFGNRWGWVALPDEMHQSVGDRILDSGRVGEWVIVEGVFKKKTAAAEKAKESGDGSK